MKQRTKLMQKQNYELDFSGIDIYSGIDAHLKSWTVSIMVEGVMRKTFSQNSNALDFKKKHLEKNIRMVIIIQHMKMGFVGLGHTEI